MYDVMMSDFFEPECGALMKLWLRRTLIRLEYNCANGSDSFISEKIMSK